MAPSILLRDEVEVTVTSGNLTPIFSKMAHDVDLSGLTSDTAVMMW